MPIDTNLNVSPYYDDFDEDKNYHRVLFRPGLAVQARELTQLQTILQNQVERFGDNIYKIGSIIKGCTLTTDFSYYYIKILDAQVDGQPVNLTSYANTLLVQEGSGLSAYVVNYIAGYESLDPNLNTLYLKYINTGSGNQKFFANGQIVTVYDRNRTVEDVLVNNGGSGYSNDDTISFTSTVGTGAVAEITTDAAGTITDVSVTSKGTGYTVAPSVTINTTTGTSASLTAINYISQVTVADSTFTAPVGTGAAVKSTDGILYQKGHFIRVPSQEVILSKYNTVPNGVVVGFAVNESIVNSSADDTLLDLALGSPNYNAPGATRLKLDPKLTVVNTAAAAANVDFLILLEYEDGNVIKDRTSTQFNSVNKELAKRTFDESGNYVKSQFGLNTQAITGNTTHFDVVVGPGVAYVNGNRLELLNNSKTPVRKGNDTANTLNHTVSTTYGNYVLVTELVGAFNIKSGDIVYLRDTAGTDATDNVGATPSTPGTVIGTARVKSLQYSSGTAGVPSCQYRLFLFDINMNAGRSFRSVRSISINGTALADIVLNASGNAELKDVKHDQLIYRSGVEAVKQFTAEEFNYRTSTNSTFTTGGSDTVTISGATLPYSGILSDTLKTEFIIIPTVNVYSSSAKTGTVSVADAFTYNVSGTSTSFTTEYVVGDYISIGNTTPKRISNIYSNSLLGLAVPFGSSTTGNTHTICYPANIPIDFTRSDKVINVTSDTTVQVSLGHSINATASYVMYHELSEFEPQVRSKSLQNPVYVKLSTDKTTSTLTGPWCLGIPDVLSIDAVYVGSSNSYSNTTTNYVSQFELDNGQKDNFYGLSYLKLKPSATLTLTSTNCLLVKLRSFTHNAGKYISTESYPIDDSSTVLPNDKIRTQDIPVYVSTTTGGAISLRDAIDFRPIVANTAILSSTVAGASIDPVTTETLVAGDKYFPSPSNSFKSTVESYLRRVDKLILEDTGAVRVIEGVSSKTPSAPISPRGIMELGIISIAPYPSLGAKEASDALRPDLKNTIVPLQTKGYSMKSIGDLDQRITRLEYYTLLSTLESNTVNVTLPSSANSQIQRFKNGFFVDSFDNYNVSNINDTEYNAQIDNSRITPIINSSLVDLQYNSGTSSDSAKTGDLITLSYTHKPYIIQPYANKQRTLVEQQWKFAGKMQVVPSYDNYFDDTTTQTSAINVDIATPLTQLVNGINQVLPSQKLGTTLLSSVATSGPTVTSSTNWNDYWWNWWWWGGGNEYNTTTYSQSMANTYIDTYRNLAVTANTVTNTQQVGNFLTSAIINPYVREQSICFYASGLRPGAQHYVFFDGVALSNRTSPALLTNFNNVAVNSFVRTGTQGSALVANTTGELAVIINVPGGTFTTGEKELLVMDFDTLDSEASATSKATGTFNSFTMSASSTNVTFSTKNFTPGSTAFGAGTYSTQRVERWQQTWSTTTLIATYAPSQDPLAQTFTVQKQTGGDTIFLTKADIFFKDKDPVFGVTFELRETDDNGAPTIKMLPFSRVHLKSEEVSVSNNASVATTFTFPSPVAVRTDQDYAILLAPDSNSPNYRIWTAQTGLPDVANSSLIPNQSWGYGTMFFSVSGRSYSAVQDEDLKFTLYRAQFTANSGTVVLNNGDFEFLTTNNVTGTFIGGEDVAQMVNTYINTTLTTNTSNPLVVTTSSDISSTVGAGNTILIVYGTSQSAVSGNVSTSGITLSNGSGVVNNNFTANFSNGNFIRIGNSIRQVIAVSNNTQITLDAAPSSSVTDGTHYTIVPYFDVAKVTAANSSSLTINKSVGYSTNSTLIASLQKPVAGVVKYNNSSSNTLYLTDSNATSDTFKLHVANTSYFGYLVGDTSQALATISSINNVNSSIFTPLLNTMVLSGTSINFKATVTKLNGGTTTSNYSLVDHNDIRVGDSIVVKSKSNEISGSTLTKSFTATLDLSSATDDTSAVIDINPSSVLFKNYNINNTLANEHTRYGAADAKYISKRLELADGLDAEDLRLFINAYKPVGTEITVYAKILNSADGNNFNDKNWSKLQQVTASSVYSNALDEADVREYEYTFKLSPESTILAGKVTAQGNSTIVGSSTTFNTDLATGDLVKIVRTSSTTDYDILPVATVGGATSLTLSGNVSFSAAGCTIEKVTLPKEAFKYQRNSGIVRYYDPTLAAFDSYKYLAIKIVLTSSTSYTVPKLNDVRAIACSI